MLYNCSCIVTTYYPGVRSLRENLRPRPCRNARSIRQGRDKLLDYVAFRFAFASPESARGHYGSIMPQNKPIRARVMSVTFTSLIIKCQSRDTIDSDSV